MRMEERSSDFPQTSHIYYHISETWYPSVQGKTHLSWFYVQTLPRYSWRQRTEQTHVRPYNCRSYNGVSWSLDKVSMLRWKHFKRDLSSRETPSPHTFLNSFASTPTLIVTIAACANVGSGYTVHTIVTDCSLQRIQTMPVG